jgi:hypothetical protein
MAPEITLSSVAAEGGTSGADCSPGSGGLGTPPGLA